MCIFGHSPDYATAKYDIKTTGVLQIAFREITIKSVCSSCKVAMFEKLNTQDAAHVYWALCNSLKIIEELDKSLKHAARDRDAAMKKLEALKGKKKNK